MVYKSECELISNEGLKEENGKLIIKDPKLFRERGIDNIVDTIILGDDPHIKRICYWVTYEAGLALGVVPSSIQGLYDARGKNEVSGFTVPAMNIRILTFDLSRAIFRAAKKINAGAFIFEIAKSEIGYTDQRPLEYTSMIMLAAMKEGYKGPIFVQGDHFQVKAANYIKNKDKERTFVL